MRDRQALFDNTADQQDEPFLESANSNEEDHEHEEQGSYYQAVRNEKAPALALSVIYANGTSQMIGYSQFVQAHFTSPKVASICFSTAVITLEGRNLLALERNIAMGRTSGFREFHAGRHDEPADEKPVITNITVNLLEEIAK